MKRFCKLILGITLLSSLILGGAMLSACSGENYQPRGINYVSYKVTPKPAETEDITLPLNYELADL
jgi:hypothetical protein